MHGACLWGVAWEGALVLLCVGLGWNGRKQQLRTHTNHTSATAHLHVPQVSEQLPERLLQSCTFC